MKKTVSTVFFAYIPKKARRRDALFALCGNFFARLAYTADRDCAGEDDQR